MAMSPQERNDAIAKALKHPLRRKILRMIADQKVLVNGDISPTKLAEVLEEPIGNVSYHVRLLAEPGILKLVRTEPRRGAVEHFYKRSGAAIDRKAYELLKHMGKD